MGASPFRSAMDYLIFLFFMVHQFVFSSAVESSFLIPKWIFVSALAIAFSLFLFSKKYSVNDYKKTGMLSLLILLPVVSDLVHQSTWLYHSLGCAVLFLVYIVFRLFYKGEGDGWAPMLCLVLFLVTFLEYFGLFFFFQGEKYHLSGYAGNPNLLACSMLFWYWIGRASVSKKLRPWFGLVCFLALLATFSRTAILGFIFLELLYLLLSKRYAVKSTLKYGFTLVLVVVAVYLIKNPHKVSSFSHLEVRGYELSNSVETLKKTWMRGIGQGNYRKAYCDNFKFDNSGELPYQNDPLYRYIRISSHGHFTPLNKDKEIVRVDKK
jgi:hypothetical protein